MISKATLLTGFLGSGKTTLLKRFLRENHATIQTGVIVNDLSELEVDGELIRMGDAVSEENDILVSLHAGSIADSKRLAFSEALKKVDHVDHIIVEASGGSNPVGILEELLETKNASLGAVVAMVDAIALIHDYDRGSVLIKQLTQNSSEGIYTIENLLLNQIRIASVIVLSKVDRISDADLILLLKTLQTLNPEAKLVTSVYGKIHSTLLLDAPPYKLSEKVASVSTDQIFTTDDIDIGSDVISDPRPFHPQRLFDHFQNNLGVGIFRSKGFIWLASRPNDVLLLNQAGGMLELELLGTWKAALLNNTQLITAERKHLEKMLKATYTLFGDRINDITVIGHSRDRRIFIEGLKKCLCHDEEISEWQNGQKFDDPWPKTIRQV